MFKIVAKNGEHQAVVFNGEQFNPEDYDDNHHMESYVNGYYYSSVERIKVFEVLHLPLFLWCEPFFPKSCMKDISYEEAKEMIKTWQKGHDEILSVEFYH